MNFSPIYNKPSRNYKGLNVAVFGLGVSGLSAIKLLSTLGANIQVYNQGDKEVWYKQNNLVDFVIRPNCFSDSEEKASVEIAKNDLIILSPGIPREHKLLNLVHEKKIPVWGEIELGFEFCNRPIIAITGTNGKTTTTTLIGELIHKAGKKAFIGGNIGTPFCDYARLRPDVDVVVLELSSFQLESIVRFHPQVALFLNLYQNHGERYSNIEDYGKAKANMAKNMNEDDLFIYASDFEFINRFVKKIRTEKFAINTQNLNLSFDPTKLKIPGHHNLINACFALKAIEKLGLDQNRVLQALYEFRGVHHRIEFVEHKRGFLAYDDAKSTNWDATLTALKAVERSDHNLKLILGGKKRGHGDSILPFLEEMLKYTNEYLLIGEMGKEIAEELKHQTKFPDIRFRYLETVANVVETLTKENFSGTLLFSPAFPSFDQFKNYEERGQVFQDSLIKY